MADVMTRWWRGYRGTRQRVRLITKLLHEKDIVASPLEDTFHWSDATAIAASEEKYGSEVGKEVQKTEGDLWNINGKVWIPPKNCDLQMKLPVITHCA